LIKGNNLTKIIFATGNAGKLQEVKKIFENSEYEIISPADLGNVVEVEETENTFEGNAFLKAEAVYNQFKLPVMADDSGLEIDQLQGRPGVLSARYAGENCTYDDNNDKIIKELESLAKPHTARFISCAVYYDGAARLSALGKLEGKMISEKRGTNGFGYDPIFIPADSDKTLAEMTLDEKNRISHRYKAFNELKTMLHKI